MFLCINNTTWETPTSDDYLEYDMRRSRYILTEFAIKNVLGYNFLDFVHTSEMSKAKRLEFTEDVYHEVWKHTPMSAKFAKEYYMANSLELREVILEALLAQARYSIRSGGNFLKDQHGVNTGKGVVTSMKGFSTNERVQYILEDAGLLYRGPIYLLNPQFTKGVDY